MLVLELPICRDHSGHSLLVEDGQVEGRDIEIEISGAGVVGEARRILCTKLTTSGPARMGRILPIMRAIFLGTILANIAIVKFWLVVGFLCIVEEKWAV
jgi:hypothetical protein